MTGSVNSDVRAMAEAVRTELLDHDRVLTRGAVERAVAAHPVVLARDTFSAMVDAVYGELAGAGILQPLLEDPAVTDVLVNGTEQVWVDRGRGLERTEVTFPSPSHLRDVAVRLASAAGCRLDDAQPTVDGRLPDGTRLHAVLHPLVEPAAVLSLRVPPSRRLRLADLVAAQSVPASWCGVLEGLIGSKASFLVSGATGAGKSTLLGSLLALVPHDERIVVIEEAHELKPEHPHVVSLQTRRPNAEGAGAVGLTQLVREALRMRPDRVVLGEARGAEIRELLTALNTGHEGGCATIHANAARDVPARLVALGMLAGMSPAVVANQAAAALNVVIHMVRRQHPQGARRFITEIARVRSDARGALQVDGALRWDGQSAPTTTEHWPGLARLLALA